MKKLSLLRPFFLLYWQVVLKMIRLTVQGKGLSPVLYYLKATYRNITEQNLRFLDHYRSEPVTEEEKMRRLQQLSMGLHALLPRDPRYRFSILIWVDQPRLEHLKYSITSVLQQSAYDFEVWVGVSSRNSPEILSYLDDLVHQLRSETYSAIGSRRVDLQTVPILDVSFAEAINQLAKKAQGSFIFILESEAWIRPDLLLRFEQALRLTSECEKTIFYCNENRIDESNKAVNGSTFYKPSIPSFPYFFTDTIQHGALIPKKLWDDVGGFRDGFDSAVTYDLYLRLNLKGAIFENIPICLYSSRLETLFPDCTTFLVQPMKEYLQLKGLSWHVEPSSLSSFSIRVLPELKSKPKVHVLIPFHNQGELTKKSVQSLKEQNGVNIYITTIDNRSTDSEIGKDLKAMGVEVIHIDEPFNFSRLNNLGVTLSKCSSDYDLLLFLNNDVVLKRDAVLEMSRWIDQKDIGMVGCLLEFPDKILQHGGLELDRCGSWDQMGWYHTEYALTQKSLKFSLLPRIVDAVTGACALVKRSDFHFVGGFDETWYPVAYSDTNLAIKLRMRGLKCFYTPYAQGVHFESRSRAKGSTEDFERSRWLHKKFMNQYMEQNEIKSLSFEIRQNHFMKVY